MRIVFGSLGAQVSSNVPSARRLSDWQHHETLRPAHGDTSIPGGEGSNNTLYPTGLPPCPGPGFPPGEPPGLPPEEPPFSPRPSSPDPSSPPPPPATARPAPAATTT